MPPGFKRAVMAEALPCKRERENKGEKEAHLPLREYFIPGRNRRGEYAVNREKRFCKFR